MPNRLDRNRPTDKAVAISVGMKYISPIGHYIRYIPQKQRCYQQHAYPRYEERNTLRLTRHPKHLLSSLGLLVRVWRACRSRAAVTSAPRYKARCARSACRPKSARTARYRAGRSTALQTAFRCSSSFPSLEV
jgi:hypothetical protein